MSITARVFMHFYVSITLHYFSVRLAVTMKNIMATKSKVSLSSTVIDIQ